MSSPLFVCIYNFLFLCLCFLFVFLSAYIFLSLNLSVVWGFNDHNHLSLFYIQFVLIIPIRAKIV